LIFGSPARAGATAIAESPTTAETLQHQVLGNPGMPAIFSGMPATWQGVNNFKEANNGRDASISGDPINIGNPRTVAVESSGAVGTAATADTLASRNPRDMTAAVRKTATTDRQLLVLSMLLHCFRGTCNNTYNIQTWSPINLYWFR
jgi:hypothetical protein